MDGLRAGHVAMLELSQAMLKVLMPKLDIAHDSMPAILPCINALNFLFTRAQTVRVASLACLQLVQLTAGLAELFVQAEERGILETMEPTIYDRIATVSGVA